MLTLNALVIDDSRVMRNMVMQALQKAKLAEFTFTEAGDGAEALTKFDPKAVDICFVDWNMPTMTGIEFVKQARARGGAGHVPMVMVTSEQSMAKIDQAMDDVGADAYICKPFTPESMQMKLQKIVNRLEAARQAPAASSGGFFSKLFG